MNTALLLTSVASAIVAGAAAGVALWRQARLEVLRKDAAALGIELTTEQPGDAQEQIERVGDAEARRGRLTDSISLFDEQIAREIEKTTELFDSGAITNTEFESRAAGLIVGIHTVPASGAWENRRFGIDVAVSRHDTKEEAVEAGREQAMRDQAEHIIHKEDGTIGERNSYGSDPRGRG